MTVYVDDVVDWGAIARARGLRYTKWAHLIADDREELHAFAKRLGLRRAWFQHGALEDPQWHYDVTTSKRDQALRLGAVSVTRAEFVALIDKRRQALREAEETP